MLAGLGRFRFELGRRRTARRSSPLGTPPAPVVEPVVGPVVGPVVEPGFVPEQLLELDQRLTEVAVQERARLATVSDSVVAELREHPRDVLGGSVDREGRSARIRFADRDVVLVSDDIEELRTVVEAAPLLPTALHTARSGRDGSVLVFSVQDWTVVIAADPVLPVDR